MTNAIAYYRVSTQKQGKSGLGLDAQTAAVSSYAAHNGYCVIGEHCEIESGAKSDRPVLRKALHDCRKIGAVLLIAKLDRLGRNLLFVATLIESKVQFIAVDNPEAKKFMMHIMAAVDEEERDRISERTKAALAIARQRGVELGKHGKYVLSKQNKRDAERFALNMQPIINGLQQKGLKTVRSISAELNRLEIPTSLNSRWHPSSVFMLLKRINEISLTV